MELEIDKEREMFLKKQDWLRNEIASMSDDQKVAKECRKTVNFKGTERKWSPERACALVQARKEKITNYIIALHELRGSDPARHVKDINKINRQIIGLIHLKCDAEIAKEALHID